MASLRLASGVFAALTLFISFDVAVAGHHAPVVSLPRFTVGTKDLTMYCTLKANTTTWTEGKSKFGITKRQENMAKDEWVTVTEGNTTVGVFAGDSSITVDKYEIKTSNTDIHGDLTFTIDPIESEDYGDYSCYYKEDSGSSETISAARAIIRPTNPNVDVDLALHDAKDQAVGGFATTSKGTKIYDISDTSVLANYKAVCNAHGVSSDSQDALKLTIGSRNIQATDLKAVSYWTGPKGAQVHWVNETATAQISLTGEIGHVMTCQSLWSKAHTASFGLRKANAKPEIVCAQVSAKERDDVTLMCNVTGMTEDDDIWWEFKVGASLKAVTMRAKDFSPPGYKVTRTHFDGELGYATTLLIKGISEDRMELPYKVQAKNKFGQTEKVVKVEANSNGGSYGQAISCLMLLLTGLLHFG